MLDKQCVIHRSFIYAITLCISVMALASSTKASELEVLNTSVITLRGSVDTDRQSNPNIAESDRTNLLIESEWTAYYGDFTFVGGFRLTHDNQQSFGLSKSRRDFYFSEWSRPTFFSDKTMLELRNFYLQYSPETCLFEADVCSLKVGKQQVVWGQADGLKVLDVVNPQSFEYFILDDYDSSRIPLWTVNYEIVYGEHEFQFLWIPDTTASFLPDPFRPYGLRSEFFRPVFRPIGPPTFTEFKPPSFGGANADFGFRYSTFQNGWDITFNVLDKLSDLPAPFVSASTESTAPFRTTQLVDFQLNRTTVVGGTLSNSFGEFVIRAEVAYTFNRQTVSTLNDADGDGVTRGDELAYVIGLDWYGLEDSLLSIQYNMTDLSRFDEPTSRGKHDEIVTLLYKKQLMNNQLSVKYIHEHNLSVDDGLVRVSLNYDYSEHINLMVEYNNFYGSIAGIFGQYRTNDHITVAMEYTF